MLRDRCELRFEFKAGQSIRPELVRPACVALRPGDRTMHETQGFADSAGPGSW